MHWLLDAHFGEDFCRIEDETVQQVLNAVRKIALNCVKTYKSKSDSKFIPGIGEFPDKYIKAYKKAVKEQKERSKFIQ